MRRIFLIRHAKAEKRGNWKGDDCERPLTAEGIEEFEKFSKWLARILPADLTFVSSPCERALNTAKILTQLLKKKVATDKQLSPGAEPTDYLQVIEKHHGNIALIGHEPDLSMFLNEITCISPNRVAFKKGAVAEIQQKKGKFFLSGFYNPKAILKL